MSQKPSKESIARILLSLQDDGIDMSETDVQELFEKSNVERARMMHDLAAKTNEDQQKKEVKKDNVENEYDKLENNEMFTQKHGPSSLAHYNRASQLSKQVPDSSLDDIVRKKMQLRELSEQIAEIEISNPEYGDDQYQIAIEEDEDTWLRSIQNALGGYNEYEKKYKVLKKLKKGGVSLDLRETMF